MKRSAFAFILMLFLIQGTLFPLIMFCSNNGLHLQFTEHLLFFELPSKTIDFGIHGQSEEKSAETFNPYPESSMMSPAVILVENKRITFNGANFSFNRHNQKIFLPPPEITSDYFCS